MSITPTAEHLQELRKKAVMALGHAARVYGEGGHADAYSIGLEAVNAITTYGHAQKAWHDAHSTGDTIWADPDPWADPKPEPAELHFSDDDKRVLVAMQAYDEARRGALHAENNPNALWRIITAADALREALGMMP